VSLFDIGLGHGFRNKFAEAIAQKSDALAKTYVSTTFVLLSIIIVCVLVVFFVVNPFLNWSQILNTSAETQQTLSLLAVIIFCFFALRFIFNIVTSVLLADQKSSLVDLISVLGSILSLLIILAIMQIGERSLLYLGLALSASPVLVLLVSCFIVFSGKYAKYSPSLKFVDFKQSKNLMGLGFMFFIPQICSMIIFSTSNVIISQLFSPTEVTVYNIAFKYFSLVLMGFGIIINPFWSAFTESYVKKDYEWVKKSIRKLIFIWILSNIGLVVMIFLSKIAYRLWVGEKIIIPLELNIALALYVCISNWNAIFVYFNNGVSKMFIQTCYTVITGIAFVPFAIFLSNRIGLIGAPLAMTLAIIPACIISPIQYQKIITNTARGLWNK
jgi:O-antigen/teichoic acid export membrane protein